MSENNITTLGTHESHQLQASRPGFDCIGIIEKVIEQTSAEYANIINSSK